MEGCYTALESYKNKSENAFVFIQMCEWLQNAAELFLTNRPIKTYQRYYSQVDMEAYTWSELNGVVGNERHTMLKIDHTELQAQVPHSSSKEQVYLLAPLERDPCRKFGFNPCGLMVDRQRITSVQRSFTSTELARWLQNARGLVPNALL